MRLGPDGLDGFWWPVSLEEVRAFRDEYVRRLVRMGGDQDDATQSLVGITLPHLVTEGLKLFQWTTVAKRARVEELTPEPPADARLLPSLMSGEVPDDPPFLDFLRRGRRMARPWVPRIARQARWSPVLNGWDPRGFLPLDRENDTVTLSATDLARIHSRRVPRAVKYRPLSDCHGPVPPPDRKEEAKITDPVLRALETAFGESSTPFPPLLETYVKRWTGYLEPLVETRLEASHTRENLGRELWTTGGMVWDRILAHCVREEGGTVVNHDHGTGAGHLHSFTKSVVDFGFCDRFITFNEAQADGIRRSANPNLFIGETPDIVPIPAGETSTGTGTVEREAEGRVRRVLVLTTMYEGEEIHMQPHMADAAAADWHARILTELPDRGYDVTFRPHPSPNAPHPDVTGSLGVTKSSQEFEETLDWPDVVVFDYPMTTTFRTTILAGLPMVLVDFGYAEWRDKARELLQRRCAVLEGWFDDENRAQVDWDELEEAIHEAPNRLDPTFEETYLRTRS